MDTNKEIKEIRAAVEDLTTKLQSLSDKENSQFVQLMFALKHIEDKVTSKPEPDDDEMYELAREAVIKSRIASTSYLQRTLRIGYSRAARLMDMLEDQGVVGPAEGSLPREVLENE